MLPVLGFLGAWLLVVVLCYLLLVLLHEMGHALVALAMQPGPVAIFLGSYGRTAGGGRLRLGRFRVYFQYNPLALALRGGLCRSQGMALVAEVSPWREIWYILGGPLLPLAVAGLGVGLAFGVFPAILNVSKAVAVVFFLVTLLSAIVNLIPRRRLVGPTHYNDGRLLQLTVYRQRTLQIVQQAKADVAAGGCDESARYLKSLLGRLRPDAMLYRQLMQACERQGGYQSALTLSQQFEQELLTDFSDDDRFWQALLLSRTDQHALALAAYTTLIDQSQPYPQAYNNRGYTYNLLGDYERALLDFDQAIALNASPAYAHNNRGLALLRLGQLEAGLAAIRHGLKLDATNAYGYRNLGIYHFDRGEYAAALAYFKQARQHDPTTHQLAEYEQKTRLHLASASADG